MAKRVIQKISKIDSEQILFFHSTPGLRKIASIKGVKSKAPLTLPINQTHQLKRSSSFFTTPVSVRVGRPMLACKALPGIAIRAKNIRISLRRFRGFGKPPKERTRKTLSRLCSVMLVLITSERRKRGESATFSCIKEVASVRKTWNPK